MENNNNGRGIFYGVIGVATLVVAIIGATFAYFSATAVANDAVNVGTTTVTLAMQGETRQFETDLIPVDADSEYFKLYPGLRSEEDADAFGKGTCRDDDGNAICSLYEFTIYNPSETVAQTVFGSIKVTANSGLSNMKYALFKGSVEQNAGKFTVTGTNTAVTTLGESGLVIAGKVFEDIDEKDDWATWTEQTLAPETGQTYTIVTWLEEAADANVVEAGKLLAAAVTFDTGTGSGITGNLSAAS